MLVMKAARGLLVLLLAASSAAAAACSLLVDTDGYTGGGAADVGADTTTTGADGSSGGQPDGAGPTDAGSDARFCSLHADAAMCVDFDDGGALGSYFGGVKLDPRVTNTIATGPFATPSLTFDFGGGTLDSGYINHEAHQQLLATVQKAASASLRLLVDRTDSSHSVRALELALSKNGGFVTFFVQVTTNGSTLYSQLYGTDGGYQSTDTIGFARAIEVGSAVRLEIQVDATKNPGQAVVLLDGQVAAPPLTFDPQLAIGAVPWVGLHLTSYDNPGDSLAATTLHYDDLLVTVQ
jgi:hypothetical protein